MEALLTQEAKAATASAQRDLLLAAHRAFRTHINTRGGPLKGTSRARWPLARIYDAHRDRASTDSRVPLMLRQSSKTAPSRGFSLAALLLG